MAKQDDRTQKIDEWLKHVQGWKDSGLSLASYAKNEGLALWAMYHWRGVLIREGHWQREPKSKPSAPSSRGPSTIPRFAKVTVAERFDAAPFTVRLHLTNGRRAEIDLREIAQLETILAALERQP